ncbi:MAG: hypothetical protein GC161_10560 [Planctomycetaceae bacterium]|nr:hypothetical protein [Planctomycetaceae bacterium]
MQKRSSLLPWMAALFTSPLAAIASPFPGEPPVSDHQAAALSGFGLVEQFGELSAQGPDYRAHFHPLGFEFVPALGLLAPKEYPLAFELQSVRGGDVTFAQGGLVLPTREDPFAVYERGAVRERYEARADGVELTFEFSSLPTGGGDLVVRGRIDCELPARIEPSGSILFEAEGLGGIRIGGVVGIDAKGRRAVGSSRMDGDVLELRLPADFVGSAELPLILDPLIGTVQHVTGVKTDPQLHVIASSSQTPGYAVAFEREFAANSIQVYGQRLDTNGNLLGAPIPISSPGGGGGGLHNAPRLGLPPVSSSFWVTWEYRTGPGANASTMVGQLSTATPLAPVELPKSKLAADSQPTLGAYSGAFATGSCMLAFLRSDNGQQQILYGEVKVGIDLSTLTNFISVGPLVAVPGAGTAPAGVAISAGVDANGLAVMAYRVRVQSSPVRHQIHCRTLRPASAVQPTTVLGPTLVINDPAVDFADVDVAGGKAFGYSHGRWQLAVESRAVLPPLSLQRVETISVNLTNPASSSLAAGPRKPVSTSVTAISSRPAIASTGAKYHISYAERPTAIGYRLRFAELDLTDAPARLLAIPSVGWNAARHTAVATRWPTANGFGLACASSLGTDCDEGMLVWPVTASPVNGAPGLQSSLFESLGTTGSALVSGVGCGHGQISTNVAPAVGHPDFRIQLDGASPVFHPSILNLTTNLGLTFSCGGCPVLVPEILIPSETVNGSAQVSLQLPNQTALIGVQIAAQWLRLDMPGTLCPEVLGLGASNALVLTIGE